MDKADPAALAHPRIVAAATPDRPAVILAETGEILTYGELVRRADQAANLFAAQGLVPGDTIALLLENHLRYAELCWAGKNLGLYYVCISTHLNAEDLAYILQNSDARLLIASAATADLMKAALGALDQPPKVLMVDGERFGFPSYDALLEGQPATPPDAPTAGASMLYSSGTTGRPKAVRPPLGQRAPERPPGRQTMLINAFGFCPDMVLINPGPLYHAAPLRKMMTAQRLGGTTVIFRKFEPAVVLDAIARYGGTHGFFVPTMFVRMLRHRDEGAAIPDLSSMRYAIHGAAPCPPSVKEAMIDWWGLVIYELYGGTEGIGHAFISPQEWLAHKGSVGKPPPGCQVRILDEEGRALGPGQDGLIYMANGVAFVYHGDEQKTAEAYGADGFATLGDIGHLDEDGYLYLTDRQSHMIISGGENIYPQEAENVLITHPMVADVAVIGVPHADFGEEARAIVEPVAWPDDPAALEAELIAYCRARLSPIKCPRAVEFIARLPRNEMGKVVKRELRRRYWTGHATLIA